MFEGQPKGLYALALANTLWLLHHVGCVCAIP